MELTPHDGREPESARGEPSAPTSLWIFLMNIIAYSVCSMSLLQVIFGIFS